MKIEVHPPHGYVELLQCCAEDLDVVKGAKVSFDKDQQVAELGDHERGLIRFLMRNHHGTPFESNFFKFRVKAPIAVFREWHRHRIGISVNEQSARYMKMQPDFYLPDDEHVRVQRGKPGAYTFEPMGSEPIPPEADAYRAGISYGDFTRKKLEAAYAAAYATYEHLMRMGVAKELARMCLPVGLFSSMVWACNARSLMAFLALRNAPTALREIRDYAQAMEDIFAKAMPVTHGAFVENGRVAP